MRSKFFPVALIGVLVLSVAAIAVASPQFKQEASVKLTTTKAGKSTGVNAGLHASDPGATPAGNLKAASRVVITLPKGTVTNTKAVKECTADENGVKNGDCPASSNIGGGSAKATVFNRTAGRQLAAGVPEKITAFAGKGEVIFLLTPQSALGQTLVIRSKLSKKGVLTTNVPKLEVLGANVILTDFVVKLKAKTKGKGKKAVRLLTNPKKCTSKGFVTTAKFTYDDGSSSAPIKTTQKCRK